MAPLILHTRTDGMLGDTTPDQIRDMIEQLAAARHTVFHVHGGLISKSSALSKAQRLMPSYRAAGVLPIFPVWESGFFDVIRNHPKRIFEEKLFQSLLKFLIKRVGGRLLEVRGGRSGLSPQPLTDREVNIALEEANHSVDNPDQPEPLSDIDPDLPPEKVTPEEEALFERELSESLDFQEAVDAVMLGLDLEPPPGARAPRTPVSSAPSLISENIKQELRATVQPGARGLFSTAALVRRGVRILVRVVNRHIQKRDHGLYTTVVEEILREFYLDAIGKWFWDRMKGDLAGTFQDPNSGPDRGGHLFLRELAAKVKQLQSAGQPLPRLSLVAHSAGSIWACEFLTTLNGMRANGLIPPTFGIDRLIFLAPACTTVQFEQILQQNPQPGLFRTFRMFALSDALEAGYWEVPPLYPRSLLYLVSGLFESEVDQPLVGMQRYVDRHEVYTSNELVEVRKFLTDPMDHSIWSKEDRGPGLESDTTTHGGFDETADNKPTRTMASVLHFLD